MHLHHWIIAVLLVSLGACANRPADQLYHDLGGQSGIDEIAEELTYRVSTDQRTAAFFDGTDLDRFAGVLAQQFCFESGGPCQYTGETMEASHRGLEINNGDFNAVVEMLQDSMSALGINVPTQNRLLARLAPMHEDIVR